MNELKEKLYHRLGESGIDRPLVPGFLRNLAHASRTHLAAGHNQVQAQMLYLGWRDLELDYHTWQLAEAYLGSS